MANKNLFYNYIYPLNNKKKMSICKQSLEKLGKAAFSALSESDQQKYQAASKIVSVLSETVNSGGTTIAVSTISQTLISLGIDAAENTVIFLANNICKAQTDNLTDAITCLVNYIKNSITDLIDQVKHDIANKLSVLFGINENPGVIGAIMEYIYRVLVKPVFSVL